MTHRISMLVTVAVAMLLPILADGAALVGQAAPDFTLSDSSGKQHHLAANQGKFVVLEWINFDCPFVGKHYGSGNMQRLQQTYTAKGVIWLAINSSAPGKQGYYEPAVAQAKCAERKSAFTAYLHDPSGTVGRAYGARTTPHMFVIDPKGVLIYAGGIDDRATTDVADISGAKNYLQAALDEALAGRPVTTASSAPYGCSVKY